jgi:hypothetical protein
MQRLLEGLYDVEAGADVRQFLLTDESFVRLIEGEAYRPALEKLLVHEIDDELNVSLYLDRDLIRRLESDPPERGLSDGNLADFWTALEGISHFVYLGWNARFDRGISRMEMELQAEVDKFVAAVYMVARQREGRVPARQLHHALFNTDFAGDLSVEEKERYRRASHYAETYCQRLLTHMSGGESGLHRQLRRFYRLTSRQKLDFIGVSR